MADITMCAGTEHPVCVNCHRRTAEPGEFVQAYFTDPPTDAEGNCEYFLEDLRRAKGEP